MEIGPNDVELEHMWRGPGKGAALQMRHLPTGISVYRVIGYEPPEEHTKSLFAELQNKLKAHEDSPTDEP